MKARQRVDKMEEEYELLNLNFKVVIIMLHVMYSLV